MLKMGRADESFHYSPFHSYQRSKQTDRKQNESSQDGYANHHVPEMTYGAEGGQNDHSYNLAAKVAVGHHQWFSPSYSAADASIWAIFAATPRHRPASHAGESIATVPKENHQGFGVN